MSLEGYPDHNSLRRGPIRPRPVVGVAPPNNEVRQVIRLSHHGNPNLLPMELRDVLIHSDRNPAPQSISSDLWAAFVPYRGALTVEMIVGALQGK